MSALEQSQRMMRDAYRRSLAIHKQMVGGVGALAHEAAASARAWGRGEEEKMVVAAPQPWRSTRGEVLAVPWNRAHVRARAKVANELLETERRFVAFLDDTVTVRPNDKNVQ